MQCAAALLAASVALGASLGNRGRISGRLTNAEGQPLPGVTVMVIGPLVAGEYALDARALRVVTNTQGKFYVARLLPGRYTLQVDSPTQVLSSRKSIDVLGGRTAFGVFVLSDLFAPFRIQTASHRDEPLGDDWKWVLRSSAATRPVLRYQRSDEDAVVDPSLMAASADSKHKKTPELPAEKVAGVITGMDTGNPLAADSGQGSAFGYLRPVSASTDVLVGGTMTPQGVQGSALVASYRHNYATGNPDTLTIVVRQLGFAGSGAAGGRSALPGAQAMTASYSRVRRLNNALTLTTGVEMQYVGGMGQTMVALPHAELAYRVDSASSVSVQYGTFMPGLSDATGPEQGNGATVGGEALLQQVAALSAAPQMTMQAGRLAMTQINHAQISYRRRLNGRTRAEIAAYHDDFSNAAVMAMVGGAAGFLSGYAMPAAVANGAVLDGGHYNSAGVRASLTRQVNSHVQASAFYATGSALAVPFAGVLGAAAATDIRQAMRVQQSEALGGKVCARLPHSGTTLVTSYEWVPPNSVTSVDPYGQAAMNVMPYMGLEIRQPLPSVAFLPLHFIAMADFSNLLAQGYTPLMRAGEDPLLLTASYRMVRGGISVQF